ncbi:MAG: ATP-binding protein [Chthoniobacteraceae bacterium]
MTTSDPPQPARLRRRKELVIALALVTTALLGVVDYVTGREIAISPLYLVPICAASWVAGRKAGMLLAAVGATAWLVAEVMEHHAYLYRAIPYWNAAMLLAIFAIVVFLLTAFHDVHVNLEKTVAKRTAALRAEIGARRRSEIAKIQAERLAVVGTMAAEVAHEIRNPLGSIALNLDLIHREITTLAETSRHNPEEGGVLVNEMRAEVHRIQHVLEEYLQFARLPKPLREPVRLNELLGQKLAFLDGEFAKAHVTLRTRFDPALAIVSADPEQLWQATLNLIRNALDATPGGGEITVSTSREGGDVLLRVADTGEGMTEEQFRQIFFPFFSTKPSGTGLGLAVVQQIIIDHGGHVECESVLGKGSTFTLFLPLGENS